MEGYATNAPYDRLIATGATLPLALTWITQLVPGGSLVMDWRGRLSGGLITVKKQSDGTATGQFLKGWREISFLQLRSSVEEPASSLSLKSYWQFLLQETLHVSSQETAYDCATHFCTYEHFRGQDEEVNFWLQWRFPDLSVKWTGSPEALSAVLTDSLNQTVMLIEQREQALDITVRGTRPPLVGDPVSLPGMGEGWKTRV